MHCGPELRVPGYVVEELLGFGATGEVWRARELATGEAVAVKRLRVSLGSGRDGPDRVRQVQREAALLAAVAHPHLLRLRAVEVVAGEVVLVLDLAPGGSLSGLLRRRGRLEPGEVVTLGVPLAEALAAVHGRGVVHGDVTAGNVLFDARGRPLLADLGLARLLGEPAGSPNPPLPADDVSALAALCQQALGGDQAPGGDQALRAAVAAALAVDPAARPTAAQFAALLYAAAAPVPLRLVAPAGPDTPAPTHPAVPLGAPLAGPAGPPRARPPRRARWALGRGTGRRRARPAQGRPVPAGRVRAPLLLAAGLLLAGLAVAWWWGLRPAARLGVPVPRPAATPATSAVPAVPPAPSPATWARVLGQLDARRAEAFTAGDAGALLAAVAPGSPAHQADLARLARLQQTGTTARGLRWEVREVVAEWVAAEAVTLRVADVLPGYDLVDSSGRPVVRDPGRGLQVWRVQLVRSAAGPWRLAEVRPWEPATALSGAR